MIIRRMTKRQDPRAAIRELSFVPHGFELMNGRARSDSPPAFVSSSGGPYRPTLSIPTRVDHDTEWRPPGRLALTLLRDFYRGEDRFDRSHLALFQEVQSAFSTLFLNSPRREQYVKLDAELLEPF